MWAGWAGGAGRPAGSPRPRPARGAGRGRAGAAASGTAPAGPGQPLSPPWSAQHSEGVAHLKQAVLIYI